MSNNIDTKTNNNQSLSYDFNYLTNRLSFLENIIKSKYSDIMYLASEISNVENMHLKYDLIDIMVKHGLNLSRYKAEVKDIKDIMGNMNEQVKENDIDLNENKNNDVKPHDINVNKEDNIVFEKTGLNNKENEEKPLIAPFNESSIETPLEQKDKKDMAREKIINNLDKLISYKENTFNDLIEMVDFNIKHNSDKVDLSKFIECLESQIVELNSYKENILNNYSLSKSIELSSKGKITFSRVFIEKERLIDKDKDEYIKVVTEMHKLYSEFVDSYLENINYMKPHLDFEKIKSMQNNCAKVIYDLKLIKNLYSSLDNIKGI